MVSQILCTAVYFLACFLATHNYGLLVNLDLQMKLRQKHPCHTERWILETIILSLHVLTSSPLSMLRGQMYRLRGAEWQYPSNVCDDKRDRVKNKI